MSQTESIWTVVRNLKPAQTQQVIRGAYFVVRQVSSGLYYVRDYGFSTDSLTLASVVGHGRAAWLVANSPAGSVESIPVDGKPMLS